MVMPISLKWRVLMEQHQRTIQCKCDSKSSIYTSVTNCDSITYIIYIILILSLCRARADEVISATYFVCTL
jgi:hypothetical protein